MAALIGLLFWSVLAIWAEARWPWAVFQCGVFALAIFHVMRTRDWRAGVPFGLLAAVAIWPVLQIWTGRSMSVAATRDAALDWLTWAVTFELARHAFAATSERRLALRGLSIFGLVLAVVAILQQATSSGRIFWLIPSGFSDGVMGPFVNRNQFACWVELVLPVALYEAVKDRRLRALHLAAAAMLFGSVVASASRAGLAMAVLEVMAFFSLAAFRKLASRKALALAVLQVVFLIAAAGTAAGWRTVLGRLDATGPELVRQEAARASLAMIRDQPWTGYGLGTWAFVYPRYAAYDSGLYLNHAHNDWLEWTAEGGLPFAACLLVFASLLWKWALRSIYGIGTVVLLLHALVDYPMQQRPALAAWLFAFSGAAMACRKEAGPHDGLLPRTGRRAHGIGGGDPPGLQETGSPAPSGSLQG